MELWLACMQFPFLTAETQQQPSTSSSTSSSSNGSGSSNRPALETDPGDGSFASASSPHAARVVNVVTMCVRGLR